MKGPLICIQCPLGCFLEVEHDGHRLLKVAGNRCKKGLEYAEREIFRPQRIVTTTVRLEQADFPLLPVKTSAAVPRDLAYRVIEEASRLRLRAPVASGQVVLADVLGTGVDLVAARSAGRRAPSAGSEAPQADAPGARRSASGGSLLRTFMRRRSSRRKRRRSAEE